MPQKGWKYLKFGQCSDCEEAGTRLFVPVLFGEPVESFGTKLVSGEHIPHFDPVCKRCLSRYNLESICSNHRLPNREDDTCKKCIPTDLAPQHKDGNEAKLVKLYRHPLWSKR